MKPDYGAFLHFQGRSPELPMFFHDVPVSSVSLTDVPCLTTLMHTRDGEADFAVSFDFTDDAAAHLLARCPRTIYSALERAAESTTAAGRTVEIDPPIKVTLETKLGPLQRSSHETFAALIVHRVI
jgi:hypothetical protein